MLLRLFGAEVIRERPCKHCGVVHGEDELCQPTISRRKFIFLSGSMFALAAMAPDSLIQSVERASPRVPYDLSEANEILKRIYLPQVKEMLENSSHLMRILQSTDDIVPVGGRSFNVPVNIKGDQAIRQYRYEKYYGRRRGS